MSKWEESIKATISALKTFKSDDITLLELDRRLYGNPLCKDAVDFASEIDPDPIDFDEYLSLLESMPSEKEYNENEWLDG